VRGVEDVLGELAGGRRRVRAVPGRVGSGRQDAVDEQEELGGGVRRPGMAEPQEFVLQEPVDALAVLPGDGVSGMAGVGEGEVGGQVAAAAFAGRDPDALTDLIGEDCVMESVQPAPTGERVEGRAAGWVEGVNLMRVRDGLIVEALGYSKTAGEVPLAAEQGLDD
ncbi:hypothetical protein JYK22_33220, partial [Nonomuraea sp. RK-328]|nr:hypothetical protein [Nonomuraea sp. RK-328]